MHEMVDTIKYNQIQLNEADGKQGILKFTPVWIIKIEPRCAGFK